METKHTKGEWNCDVDDYCTYKYNLTSIVKGLVNLPSRKEAEANAKLIASAPDLLEACFAAFKYFQGFDSPEQFEMSYDKLESAIKKATE